MEYSSPLEMMNGMSDDVLIQELKTKLKFTDSIATAFVKAHVRCEYCGYDLLRDRQGYASATVDHLLPKGTYDENVAENPNNWALSCFCCNSTKGKYDVLEQGEDANVMLNSERGKLIDRAKKYISGKMLEYDRQWLCAIEILLNRYWTE